MERKSFIKSLTALLSLPLTSIPEAFVKMGEGKDMYDAPKFDRSFKLDEFPKWQREYNKTSPIITNFKEYTELYNKLSAQYYPLSKNIL